jgi:hypothetical protein
MRSFRAENLSLFVKNILDLHNLERKKYLVNAYRLLGRELITDRITVLFELVKNCYDVNSTEVRVEFFDANPLIFQEKKTFYRY